MFQVLYMIVPLSKRTLIRTIFGEDENVHKLKCL